ncbi:MAG: hypothetical protein GX272_02585 [Epulopiscium sp.]|nr:hypothetical protein [Candidatus Epulonipiscium sp.]
MSNIIKSPSVKINREKTVYIDINEKLVEEIILEEDDNTAEVIKENIILKAQQDAHRMIQEAEKMAAQILEQAKKDAMFARMKIEEEGRQQGYQEGFRQGSEESKKLLKQAKLELENAIQEKNKMLQEIEPKVVDLIISISKKVLDHAFTTNKQSIIYLIKKGLSEIKDNNEKIIIKISEMDYTSLMESKENILNSLGFSGKIDLVQDSSLQSGDCIIETQFGNIDCSLGTQFEGLKQELLLILDSK